MFQLFCKSQCYRFSLVLIAWPHTYIHTYIHTHMTAQAVTWLRPTMDDRKAAYTYIHAHIHIYTRAHIQHVPRHGWGRQLRPSQSSCRLEHTVSEKSEKLKLHQKNCECDAIWTIKTASGILLTPVHGWLRRKTEALKDAPERSWYCLHQCTADWGVL